MKKLLLPLLLFVVGVGGGVGAGVALAPSPAPGPIPEGEPADGHAADAGAPAPEATEGEDAPAAEAGHEGEDAPAEGAAEAAHAEAAPAGDDHGEAGTGLDYVRFNNQFVVPVVNGGEVSSLVLMSLSVETQAGQEENVLLIEPKLRDVFLQVLFDHANTGGFDGLFTGATAMRTLRAALLRAAQAEVGDLVSDVLIVELVRQDT